MYNVFKENKFASTFLIVGIILALVGLTVLIYSIAEGVRREKNQDQSKQYKFNVGAGMLAGCILIVISSIPIGIAIASFSVMMGII